MTTPFTVTAKSKPDTYTDNVSKGDVTNYSFDFSPWQEDNDEITSFTWTVEGGQCGLGTPQVNEAIATNTITFSESGSALISVLAITATARKKVWLMVNAKDMNIYRDDYGIFNNG